MSEERLVFGIILFFRGWLILYWAKDFFTGLLSLKITNYDVVSMDMIEVDHE